MLEDRTLLSVSFVPGPLAQPAVNTVDRALGNIGSLVVVEPMITVNERDPANIAISTGNGLRLSTNGGATASATVNFPLLSGATGAVGDTDTAFDGQGRLFWTNLQQNPDLDVTVAQFNSTTGSQVGSTSNVNGASDPNSGIEDDKQFLVADVWPNSQFNGRLYVVWTKNPNTNCASRVMFSRSTDQAANWSAPILLSDSDGPNNQCGNNDDEGFVWPSDVTVAPNGDVYVAYHAQPEPINPTSGTEGRTFVLRSTDGGVSFPQKVMAFTAGASDVTFNVQSDTGRIPGAQFWTQGSAQPFVLADPTRPGNVYVITADDPDNVHGSGDDANVVIARSTNHGLNWSTLTIAAGPTNSFQLFPTAAIDTFGTIVVAWYDNRAGLQNGNENYLLDLYATYSTDSGITWAPEFMVNDSNNHFDPDAGAVQRFPFNLSSCDASTNSTHTCRMGEYFGLDVFGNSAYVAWTCNTFSTGGLVSVPNGQQVCFDTFPINGTVTISGDDSGAATDDTIVLQPITDNAAFLEVLVNGQRQYAGREGNMILDGLAGNDSITNTSSIPCTLVGGLANDTITGGSQNDVMHGGPGNDTLDGAGGTDTVSYSTASGSVTLSLGSAVQPRTTADGDGGQDNLIAIENVIGSNFGDSLLGDSGPNSIKGGGGDDSIAGRAGNDTLDGGEGMDTATYALAAAAVSVDLSLLALQASVDGDGSQDTLLLIENLLGTAFNDLLKGDSSPNSLNGANGNDTLDGNDGDDTLVGQSGDDSLVGGLGNDSASYANAASAVIADLSAAQPRTSSDGNGGKDNLIAIEYLLGSSFNDLLIGDTAANLLDGFGGNDTLTGGMGNDTLIGRAGNDSLDGGQGSDTASYAQAGGAVSSNLSATFQPRTSVDGDGGQDDLIEIENIVGSSFGDVLLGDTAGNVFDGGGGGDSLVGGNGDDTFIGRAGVDTLDGGQGIDTASYTFASGPVTSNLAANAQPRTSADGDGGQDNLTDIENLIGSNFADTITGDPGHNRIQGNGGNDTLRGGLGNDTLIGESGNDSLLGEDGADTASYETAPAGVTSNLKNDRTNQDGHGNTDNLDSIETLMGSNFDDTLTGDKGANLIVGLAGNDFLVGGKANDSLTGGNGDDTSQGNQGNDSLLGESGNDDLRGGKQNDTLEGGLGNDRLLGEQHDDSLSGGAGNDVLIGDKGSDTLNGGLDTDMCSDNDALTTRVDCEL